MTVQMLSPLFNLTPERAVLDHDVWGEIGPEFTPHDFNHPYAMDAHFLRWLSRVRRRAGVPMWITSDARDPDGRVGADKSAHKKRPCRAIDGQVKADWNGMPGSEQLARIYLAAAEEGCVRFGTYRSSQGLGDVYHLDCETNPDNPSPRWWTKW